MAGRKLFSRLDRGFRCSNILSQSGSELSRGIFFSVSDSAAGRYMVQASSERSYFSSVVRRYAGPAPQSTYGVGAQMGGDRDPKSKADTPDDFRALDIHATEPKEITKESAAKAMQEPPDYQISKSVPEESKPIEEDADPQRADEGKAFDDDVHKQKGTAQYQGDTTGTEKSGHEVEGQYGAGPDEGKTTRS